jgi:hypothetical protein
MMTCYWWDQDLFWRELEKFAHEERERELWIDGLVKKWGLVCTDRTA